MLPYDSQATAIAMVQQGLAETRRQLDRQDAAIKRLQAIEAELKAEARRRFEEVDGELRALRGEIDQVKDFLVMP